MNLNDKILILGGNGLVGNAIYRKLNSLGFTHIMSPRSYDLNLCDKNATLQWFEVLKPDYVFFSAAKVGGIQANINSPVEFGLINTEIINNTLYAAHEYKVKKLLFFGSSCIYPKNCNQPMKEEYLLSGSLEPTNELYAISKIYGIKMCAAYKKQYGDNFISCQPCNIYGPGDNFDPINSHVIAANIRKFHESKNMTELTCWGDGSARREFLHCDDLADASIFLMENYNDSEFINVGFGDDVSIKELSELIKKTTNFNGNIKWDTSKPNGMPKKLLDITKIKNLGWNAKISLENGLIETYKWFLENKGK